MSKEPLEILKQGVAAWNAWKADAGRTVTSYVEDYKVGYREVKTSPAKLVGADLNSTDLRGIDLSDAWISQANLMCADLRGANLQNATLSNISGYRMKLDGADMSHANLREAHLIYASLPGATLDGTVLDKATLESADLSNVCGHHASFREANLKHARLSGASLRGARLYMADLHGARLQGVDLTGADLTMANLNKADLSDATLEAATLESSTLVGATLKSANLSGCRVYGASIWDVTLTDAIQNNLVISPLDERSKVTVDNLEVAQFIHLLLKNEKIRHVIDTITTKAVLILGRFTPARKEILDAIKEALRDHGYVPILFDFPPSPRRDLTETIHLLASMSKFVIADITDARSIPQELSQIIPNLPSVPVQPLLQASSEPYSMFEHWSRFGSVLPVCRYENRSDLVDRFDEEVISPVDSWNAPVDEVGVLRKRIEDLEAQLRSQD